MKSYILCFCFFFSLFLVFSCSESSKVIDKKNINKSRKTPIERIFPVPYFPEKRTELFSLPLATFSSDWAFACIYSPNQMNAEQVAFYKSLSPKKDGGEWGTSFERDFDGDGMIEIVNYGVYEKTNKGIGNFLLITRKTEDGFHLILTREFPEEAGHFACFYLKKDKSIIFGSGLIGSELMWSLSWEKNEPKVVFHGWDDP